MKKASAASVEVMRSALDGRRRRLQAQLLTLQKKAAEHGIEIKSPDETHAMLEKTVEMADVTPEQKTSQKRQRRGAKGKQPESGDDNKSAEPVQPIETHFVAECRKDRVQAENFADLLKVTGDNDSLRSPEEDNKLPKPGAKTAEASTGKADKEAPAPRRSQAKRRTTLNSALTRGNGLRMSHLLKLKQDNHEINSQIKEIEEKMRAIAASIAKGEVVSSDLLGDMVASRTGAEDQAYQAEKWALKLQVRRLQQKLRKQRMSWTSPQLGDMALAALAKAAASAAAFAQKEKGRRRSTLVTGLLKNQRASGQSAASAGLGAKPSIAEGEETSSASEEEEPSSAPIFLPLVRGAKAGATSKVRAAVNTIFVARSWPKGKAEGRSSRRRSTLASLGGEPMPSVDAAGLFPEVQATKLFAERTFTGFGSGRRFSSGLGVQSLIKTRASAPAGELKALRRPTQQPHEIFQKVQLQLVGRSPRGRGRLRRSTTRFEHRGSLRFSFGRSPSPSEDDADQNLLCRSLSVVNYKATGAQSRASI